VEEVLIVANFFCFETVFLCAGVMAAIKGFQAGAGDVGVDLRGGNVGVSQKQLHGAKVGAVIEQMGGKGVA
jgi:hypothetical protein